jgi:transmembrane sensor
MAQRLAEQLGDARARGVDVEAMPWADEEFVDALHKAVTERDARRPVAPTAAQSERMWQRIESEMEPAPSLSPATWLRRTLDAGARQVAAGTALQRWAVALAVFLVGAVAAWLVLLPAGPERVAVAERQAETYVTPGNATVTLRPHSALYRLPADTAARYRLEGEAYFQVPPRAGAGAFEVHTDEARVRVLGTRFVVRTWPRGTEVYLEEGRVQLATFADTARALAAGQRASVSPAGELSPPRSASRAVYVGWLDRTLHLERRPLRRVIDEVEHHYALQLRVPERLKDQTLTGQIRLDDPSQTLRDLARVLGGRFERVSNDTYRFVAE